MEKGLTVCLCSCPSQRSCSCPSRVSHIPALPTSSHGSRHGLPGSGAGSVIMRPRRDGRSPLARAPSYPDPAVFSDPHSPPTPCSEGSVSSHDKFGDFTLLAPQIPGTRSGHKKLLCPADQPKASSYLEPMPPASSPCTLSLGHKQLSRTADSARRWPR